MGVGDANIKLKLMAVGHAWSTESMYERPIGALRPIGIDIGAMSS
jgi:hypothetical protein